MPAGKTRRLRAEEILYYKGDPATDMYLVIEGQVRLVDGRWAAHRLRGSVVRTGEFFGESALVDDAPREHTAIADVPTLLLCIDKHEIRRLAMEQPTLAARILSALKSDQPSNRAASPNFVPLSGFDPSSRYLYLKTMTCPLCQIDFEVEVVRESRLAVETRYPDFRVRYRDIEPLWYRYTVCPKCFYTAKRSEFEAEPSAKAVEALESDRAEREAQYRIFDFSQARDAALAAVSVRLAEHCLEVAQRPALDRALAALNAMWLFEDAEDKVEARRALARATDLYIEAYHNSDSGRSPKVDQRVAYLIGWLSHRLYKTQQSMTYISEAVKLGRQGDANVNAMIRELLPSIRQRRRDSDQGVSEMEGAGAE